MKMSKTMGCYTLALSCNRKQMFLYIFMHEYFWISMDICGYPWISMDIPLEIHEYLWKSIESMDIHEYSRISMNIHGYPWKSMDIHTYPWFSSPGENLIILFQRDGSWKVHLAGHKKRRRAKGRRRTFDSESSTITKFPDLSHTPFSHSPLLPPLHFWRTGPTSLAQGNMSPPQELTTPSRNITKLLQIAPRSLLRRFRIDQRMRRQQGW